MAGATDIIVRFIGDTSKLKDDIAQTQTTTQSSWSKWGGAIAKVTAGAFATDAVIQFGITAIKAADDAAAAQAGLRQVFRQMGATTDKAADKAIEYAGALSKQIAVDDEAIIGAQTILGTFKGVGDEAGRTSGVFKRSTKAAFDMAQTFKTDAGGAATQLGKALQDPVTGMSALSRTGVKFDQVTQDQIKSLQEQGDLLGAQKMLLAGVETQVQGTAAAAATSFKKTQVAFMEAQEQLGTAMLPLVEAWTPILIATANAVGPILDAVSWIVSGAIEGFERMGKAILAPTLFAIGVVIDLFNSIKGPVLAVVDVVVATFQGLVGFFSGLVSSIGGIISGIGAVLVAPFQWAYEQILSIFDGIRSAGASVFAPFESAISSVKAVWNSFAKAWNGIKIKIPEVDLPIVGKVGGGTIDLPNLPQLAAGGIVRRQTLAMLHPREAVVPLPRRGMGGNTYNVNVQVTPGTDPAQTGRAIVDLIGAYERANGRAWRTA